MLKPVAVTALPEYRLRVEYADGVKGTVDLSHLVGDGVFAAWNDPAVFEAVAIGEHGELRWSDDVELCPDAMYLVITGKPAEDIFPTLRAPADA
jgi:hypothetical protein